MSNVTAVAAVSCFFHAERSNGELLAGERCQLLSVTSFGTTKVALLKADKKASNHATELSPRS